MLDRSLPSLDSLGLADADVVFAIRSAYLLAAAAILLVNSVPALSNRFLAYGSRSTQPEVSPNQPELPQNPEGSRSRRGRLSTVHEQDEDATPKKTAAKPSTATTLLNYISTYRVPHSFFTHFYILSVASSIFWAHQILTHDAAFQFISSHTALKAGSWMSTDQVVLVWLLMLFQGVRRLLESLVLTRKSSSTMWIPHWGIGLAFYLLTGVGVWIEGLPALLMRSFPYDPPSKLLDIRLNPYQTLNILLFALSSFCQNTAHRHLSSLSSQSNPTPSPANTAPSAAQYKLPSHPLFLPTVTPHYFFECTLYFSLAALGAPEGQVLNKTLSCALAFVIVNLGVTAQGTRAWYISRFGKEKVGGRWRMVPGVW